LAEEGVIGESLLRVNKRFPDPEKGAGTLAFQPLLFSGVK
jgi:hypothetical protein